VPKLHTIAHTMAKRFKLAKPSKVKLGPKADILKTDGDWQAAVKKSLGKKKPATGWPGVDNGTGRG
jgi:hypothetical protein